VSIVIPTYNEAENISRLIEAIEDNLPPGFFTEIIVVDDNSPDGTGKIVETYNSIVIYVRLLRLFILK
jgi:dolichol-phosphate mannosyltransferase